MILKRCSAFLFFFLPLFSRSGRANVQSDTFNILEETDRGKRSMLHYFSLFYLGWCRSSGGVLPKPPTAWHPKPQASAEKDNKRHKRAGTIMTTYRRSRVGQRSPCVFCGQKSADMRSVTRGEPDGHHSYCDKLRCRETGI